MLFFFYHRALVERRPAGNYKAMHLKYVSRTQLLAYLASPVKVVEVSPGAPIEKSAVLSSNLFAHVLSVEDEPHETLDLEGRGCDSEGGHLCSQEENR